MSAASTSGYIWSFADINRLAGGTAGAGQADGRNGDLNCAGRVAAAQVAAWDGPAGGLAGVRAGAAAWGGKVGVAVAVQRSVPIGSWAGTSVPANQTSESAVPSSEKLAGPETQHLRYSQFSSAIDAHALLDPDLEESELTEPNIHLLPVSMVENFLVEPSVLWEAATVVHHRMDLCNVHDVEVAMNKILDSMEEAEVDRRIKATIGATTFRVNDPVSSAPLQLEDHFASLKERLSERKLAAIRDDCRAKVEQVKAQGRRMDFYHGKAILDEFYRRHMHNSGMSKEIFVYSCTRVASTRPRVRGFVDSFLAGIGIGGAVDAVPQEVDDVPGSPTATSAPRA